MDLVEFSGVHAAGLPGPRRHAKFVHALVDHGAAQSRGGELQYFPTIHAAHFRCSFAKGQPVVRALGSPCRSTARSGTLATRAIRALSSRIISAEQPGHSASITPPGKARAT